MRADRQIDFARVPALLIYLIHYSALKTATDNEGRVYEAETISGIILMSVQFGIIILR